MAPALFTNGWHNDSSSDSTPPQASYPHEQLRFDPKLQPKKYAIAGTHPNSRILFTDVNILDSTGREPYRGDVYIEGERIAAVGRIANVDRIKQYNNLRIIDGRGRILMSGLGDAHTHLSWNNNALDLLGNVGVEEHVLITAKSALCYLDSGYTMCYGAASAKDRLDCVIRDAINNGDIPGPRYLANGKEIAKREGELAAGITTFADGPLEMREVIRHHAGIGVDQIKLSMSGEAITESKSAEECFYSDEETAACVEEAHRNGLRVCAHARARDSVIQCVRHGVDVIYHASYTDSEGMTMLVKNKHKHVVAPAINWLYATVYEAEPFGYTFEQAERVGYKKELEVACQALKEMHKKGITVLPGGDYGFAWCPHGTYARDLEHFVKLLGFTPMESIIAATAGVAKLFMQENELGKILPGYYADCILVNGDPIHDISVLQKHDKVDVIMINGKIHKSSPSDFVAKESQNLPLQTKSCFNFVAYQDENGRRHIGHLDFDSGMIERLAMASGSPLCNLHEVIAVGDEVAKTGHTVSVDSAHLLPPIGDRDIICVGNNYAEHTKELKGGVYDNGKSGKDTYPTIFTKRSSSIIATNESIYSHPEYTSTLDYEGEIGVIIGKTASGVSEQDASEYIWGYTIINDVSAREKQRDHGQFLMGKSPDTFCPIGPAAVPAAALPSNLRVQTFVNGEKRQDGTSDSMITSIPKLISIISQGMTLQAGDIIATGTPAGVGAGMQPPQFLKPGDLVEVQVTGLGKLSNRITDVKPQAHSPSQLPVYNFERTWGGAGLTQVGDKWMNVRDVGSGPDTIVLVHGLGGNLEYYESITSILEDYRVISYDLEGHGLSPTRPSLTTLESYVQDLKDLLQVKNVQRATVVGWSLGGLIAMLFAEQNISLVEKLVLLGPGPNPFPSAAAKIFQDRAVAVRELGMEASGIAKIVAKAATGPSIDAVRSSAIRQSLLATHPEGYAKGCVALARSVGTHIQLGNLDVPVLIIAGEEDKISNLDLAKSYVQRLPNTQLEVLRGVGHWHVIEDCDGVKRVLKRFL